MYNAPPVHYQAGGSRFAASLALAAWLAGAVSTTAWVLLADRVGWRQSLAVACVLLCAVLAWRLIAGAQRGVISWTGQHWRWSPGASDAANPASSKSTEGGLVACLDLQRVMLLQFRSTGRLPAWLWVERRLAPQRWDELRRAVYSRARVAKPAEPEPH